MSGYYSELQKLHHKAKNNSMIIIAKQTEATLVIRVGKWMKKIWYMHTIIINPFETMKP